MPPRRGRFRRPPPSHSARRDTRSAGRVALVRRAIPQPESPLILRPRPTAAPTPEDDHHEANGSLEGEAESWELICRDGWEWQPGGPSGSGLVYVRVAELSPVQAQVVAEWVERIKTPAIWWAVSRELLAPGSSPEVARAIQMDPWLTEVLPLLLEASTEGAPPPPDQ